MVERMPWERERENTLRLVGQNGRERNMSESGREKAVRESERPNLYYPLLDSGSGPCDWRSLKSGDLVTNQEKRKGD